MGKEKGNEKEEKELKARGTDLKWRWAGMQKIKEMRSFFVSAGWDIQLIFSKTAEDSKLPFPVFSCVPKSRNLLWVVCLFLLFLPNLYAFSCSHSFCCWLESHLHLSGNLSLGQKFIEKTTQPGLVEENASTHYIFCLLRPSTGTFMRHKILVWMSI